VASSTDLVKISPEALTVANTYLATSSILKTSEQLSMPTHKVSDFLQKREVKKYIDTVYMDTGFRNRSNIAEVLDTMIEGKLQEALESDMYTKKDLADLLALAHKIRMDEAKLQNESNTYNVKNQTNIQVNDNPYDAQGNYGKLLKNILQAEPE
jgi:phage terminase small subunit